MAGSFARKILEGSVQKKYAAQQEQYVQDRPERRQVWNIWNV